MALFGKKLTKVCIICNSQTSPKFYKTKEGRICSKCLIKAGGDLRDLFPAAWISLQTRKQILDNIIARRQRQEAYNNFNFDTQIEGMKIDYPNKKWAIWPQQYRNHILVDSAQIPIVYDFDAIWECELSVNEQITTQIKKQGIGRAFVGGALAGSVGAMVGATTGKSVAKSSASITSMSLVIKLATDPVQRIEYPFAISSMQGFFVGYSHSSNIIIDSLRKIVESSNDSQFVNRNSSADETTELRKFKSLLDDGIITLDEFEAKKKQLLGL